MSAYYYFTATLPSLQPNLMVPPLSYDEFVSRASLFLSESDMALVSGARLFIEPDGRVPPALAGSGVLARYYAWERSLRNELSRLRAVKLQKSPEKYRKEGDIEPDGMRAAQLAFQSDDPLQAELILEKERWLFIEMLSANTFFTCDYLATYALLLQILERRALFGAEHGQAVYTNVYNSIVKSGEKI